MFPSDARTDSADRAEELEKAQAPEPSAFLARSPRLALLASCYGFSAVVSGSLLISVAWSLKIPLQHVYHGDPEVLPLWYGPAIGVLVGCFAALSAYGLRRSAQDLYTMPMRVFFIWGSLGVKDLFDGLYMGSYLMFLAARLHFALMIVAGRWLYGKELDVKR